MSLSRSTMKAVAVGGIALSSIAVGVVAANATPTALPVLSATTDTAEETVDAAEDSPEDTRRGRGDGGMRGEHAAELAERLGVEESALQDAMATLRETRREEGRDAMAAALAEVLGIDEETVTAAMDELRAEHQSAARTTLAERLDVAVQDGTLTEADKESVLKAIAAGLLGRGPGGRG